MTIPSIIISFAAAAGAVLLFWLFLTRTALGRGFRVPFAHLARRRVTIEYPDVKREPQDRYHGRHQLNFYEDGLERCIGCELCAWACPADAIFVQGADNTAEARYSPGERYAADYQINYNRCILCGLCIEACPTRALTMTHDYEFSADTRAGLVYTKERLLAPVPDTAEKPAPHTDAEVRARGINYYGGLAVTPPDLRGGEYAPAGPRPMARANSRLAGLKERTASVPARAAVDTVEMGSRTTAAGEDDSYLQEPSDQRAPTLPADEAKDRWHRTSGDERGEDRG